MHIIEQFNGGVYDTIIASDEKLAELNEDKNDKDEKKHKSKSKRLRNHFFGK